MRTAQEVGQTLKKFTFLREYNEDWVQLVYLESQTYLEEVLIVFKPTIKFISCEFTTYRGQPAILLKFEVRFRIASSAKTKYKIILF